MRGGPTRLFVPKFILRLVWGLCFISGIIAQTAELLKNEIRRRSKASMLAVCEVLDILINGKLSAAKDMGIRLDIVRAEAPKTLPVSDSDLCSLIVNILDNAIHVNLI